MVPWLVAACLHAVKRLHAQGHRQLTRYAHTYGNAKAPPSVTAASALPMCE